MENVQQQTEQARALERAERFDAAREAYARLASEEGAHQDDAAFWLHLADLEAREGASDDVLAHYARAIDLFEEAGHRNVAVALCHRVLGLFPDDADILLRLGRLSATLGYGRDARAAIDAYARRMEERGEAEAALRELRALRALPPGDAFVRDAIARLGGGAAAEPADSGGHGAALPTLPGLDGLDGLDAFGDDGDDRDEDDGGSLPGLEPLPLDELPTFTGAPDPSGSDLGLEPTSLDASDAVDDARFGPLEGLETTHGADEWDDAPPSDRRDSSQDLPLVGLAPDETEADDEPLPTLEPPVDEIEDERGTIEPESPDDGDLPLLAPLPAEEEPEEEEPEEEEPEEEEPEPAAGEEGDYVDLGALILSDDDDAPTTLVPPGPPAAGEDPDFEEILALFREKIDREIDDGDAASHYDLGLAFKEMGLLDDAVAQLQAALRGGANPLATLEVLGECFVEKGEHAVAEQVLARAAGLQGAREGDLLGVRYWLGRCHEAAGRLEEARADYHRVTAVDAGFRDAAERLGRLGAGPDAAF